VDSMVVEVNNHQGQQHRSTRENNTLTLGISFTHSSHVTLASLSALDFLTCYLLTVFADVSSLHKLFVNYVLVKVTLLLIVRGTSLLWLPLLLLRDHLLLLESRLVKLTMPSGILTPPLSHI